MLVNLVISIFSLIIFIISLWILVWFIILKNIPIVNELYRDFKGIDKKNVNTTIYQIIPRSKRK